MPSILAIDTSSEFASVALLHGDTVLSRLASGAQTHSQTLLPMVQQVLQEAGISLADCAAIAFGAGPGSFTGVRTACGVAQGLAFGADRPVVAISTLEAMAQACHESTGASAVLALLDARMGEVYWAQYRFTPTLTPTLEVVIAPCLSAPDGVQPIGIVTACGNGLSAYAEAFAGRPFMQDAHADLMPHAAQVASLARLALVAGAQVAARDAQPIYLRNKIALTTAERLLKSQQVSA
ncbi:tRNA (adenosine(37)-N6)-threonylcarbamoyltransferase complex dimerization subunit type 1 TsaB [Actimicrobium sp. CCC2.4]|uniref:tRNA (adenosine(37)-N6)-threonylcarbamoyltransferase complex dimerization subunit type 1 TsaB n=1 Tax=Actimicrobium sp. CCC2.4 TaxID=3048606 RepID=UPI002AC94B4D|nr:tRNA (adenosine(37)-N6)-threonylcarbamoyltransferase complex dimerization subunit type 1 TsaB [Actimicrobium sp. CCC2.4]MEB0133892.1 tRNA (adenosine(37)-N6)-threonylcarbamoyltransferase complex dimerization subunit type 1 TsaB [Actimicrobium sp. CCC2.4]WPX34199.1 tRNA (adenosine(37)-N6)-threonylcarbamoyltransferase complex dimerization subunit type 1 TsaB [Actimicrobium sp. CCC2.4]